MLNKNFFLGVLTTVLVVGILAVGGLFALRANAGVIGGGRPGGFEQRANRESQPGNSGNPGEPGQDNRRFENNDRDRVAHGERGGGHANFSPLRGLGGILGSLLTIGVIIAAVVGGSMLFKRSRRQSKPTSAIGSSAPVGSSDEPLTETPIAELPESGKLEESPAEPSEESPAEPSVEDNDVPAGESTDPKTTNAA